MSKNKTVRNIFFSVFCVFACIIAAYAESCSTAGATQNKYTASGWSYSEWMPTSCVCASPNKWSSAEKACIKCSWSEKTTMNMPTCPDGYDGRERAMADCKRFRDQFVKGEVSALGKTGIEVITDCDVKLCERAHPLSGTYKYYWTITYKHHTCSKIY